MKPVKDHPRVRYPRPQRFLPTRGQVCRHQGNPFAAGRSQQVEERVQRLGAAPLAGPHHPPGVMVDDNRQVVMPLAIAELVVRKSSGDSVQASHLG